MSTGGQDNAVKRLVLDITDDCLAKQAAPLCDVDSEEKFCAGLSCQLRGVLLFVAVAGGSRIRKDWLKEQPFPVAYPIG